MEKKFRAWNKKTKDWHKTELPFYGFHIFGECTLVCPPALEDLQHLEIEQFTGLTSSNDKEWYVGDIGQFPNGDKFILKMESWLEVFADWIGDPECEDQTRDLYRIERAKKIGTIHDEKQ